MKVLAAILAAALCASCATDTQRLRINPTVVRESVTPKIEFVSESNHQTQLVAGKLQTQVDTLHSSTSTLADQMTKLASDLDHMRTEKETTATERDSAYQIARSAVDKATSLIAENEAVKSTMSEMQIALAAVDTAIEAARKASAQKDAEVTEIRAEKLALQTNAIADAKEITTLKKKVDSMQGAYDLGIKVRWIAGIVILLVVAYVVLRALSAAGKISLPLGL